MVKNDMYTLVKNAGKNEFTGKTLPTKVHIISNINPNKLTIKRME